MTDKLEPGVIYLGVDRSGSDEDVAVWGRVVDGVFVVSGCRIGPRLTPPEGSS